jgi:3-oxoacyl-[acyl-carrier protein] reductase
LTDPRGDNRLAGKVWLITGGGSGLGWEVAKLACRNGGIITILDVRRDRVEGMVHELRRVGANVAGIAADVSREDEVRDAVARVVAQNGRLDVLINAAGLIARGPITESTMADFDRVYSTNVRGTYMMCREAARQMVEQRSGYIVNISSIAGKRGSTDEAAYASGKWAIVGLGECLALELGPFGVRVTTVCPSGMDTAFWESDPRDRSNWRLISARHVAEAIVGLVSLPADVVVKEAVVTSPGR